MKLSRQMKWYYKIEGGHTHVRVFMNGGKCGDLCFRNEEFEGLQKNHMTVDFIEDIQVNNRNKLLEQHLWVSYLKEIEAVCHDACDCKSCQSIRADFPAWKEQREMRSA